MRGNLYLYQLDFDIEGMALSRENQHLVLVVAPRPPATTITYLKRRPTTMGLLSINRRIESALIGLNFLTLILLAVGNL
jgi:hypothetical protein